MKTLLRNVAIYTYILFVLTNIIPGVTVHGGFLTFVGGGIGLTFLFMIVRPILNLISLPANFLTLGLFSIVINSFLLYLLTIFVVDIRIASFTYEKMQAFGFATPQISFNTFFAYLYAAFVVLLLDKIINWLRE